MVDRKAQILELLKAQEAVSIAELTRSLEVSRETIRKDLYELEVDGLLTKVRGGAVLTASNAETAYDLRSGSYLEAKKAIARRAAQEVSPGDTVYLDYGTTTYRIAGELASIGDITVVTNALPIVELLSRTPSTSVIIPGGILRGNENSLYGPITNRSMRYLHFDVGFFGCNGADPAVGFTNPHRSETEVSSLAIERSSRAVMVIDNSKFGVVAEHVICPQDQPDLLITDSGASKDFLDAFQAHGVQTVVAEVEGAKK